MRALGLASAAAGRVTARAPRGRRPLRWYIMTSAATDAATRAFFERHAWFGLRREQVAFFQQGELPCLTPEGRLILERPGRLARAPDGNGGLYAALAECALTPCMANRLPPTSRNRELRSTAYAVDSMLCRMISLPMTGVLFEARKYAMSVPQLPYIGHLALWQGPCECGTSKQFRGQWTAAGGAQLWRAPKAWSPMSSGGGRRGVLADMAAAGVEAVDCVSVDNALACVADPLFAGFCWERGAQCGAPPRPAGPGLPRPGVAGLTPELPPRRGPVA